MTTHSTRYATHHEPSARDELLSEIQDLDWRREDAPPIREAAELIYRMGNGAEHENDDARHQELAKLLTLVPQDYRVEVIANVPPDLREDMLDRMPQQIRGMVEDLKGQTLSLMEHREAVHSESLPHQESGESANQYRPELIQNWEREIVQDSLDVVEGICGEESARHIEKIIEDSRDLAIRELPGYQWMYRNDEPQHTHHRYLDCISQIPATVEAKLNARVDPGWTLEEYQEAALHEVNRMAYRLNLEIQDRLITKYEDQKLFVNARERGMDRDTLDKLWDYGLSRSAYAKHCRHMECPTARTIEQQSRACLTHMGLEKAVNENDTEAMNEILLATQSRRSYQEREQFIEEYLGRETTGPIEKAQEISAQWTDEVIMDGRKDFHFKYTNLEYVMANEARERWLEYNGYTETRAQLAGDCVVRALNEATGGKNYGPIWSEINQVSQTAYQPMDPDFGTFKHQYEKAYQKHGMQNVLDTLEDPANPMGQHLDLREIPALLEGLTGQDGNQISFIASTRLHNAAVVDGAVHDTWDSRDMGARECHPVDGRLIYLWLKCDEETANAARNILEKYARARQFDDNLTQGVRWRMGQ